MQRMIALVGAAVLLLSACGSISEQLVEEALEQAAEAASEEGVEFEINDDGVTVESDEGSFQIGSGELPEGFDFELPDGYELVTAARQQDGEDVSYYVQVHYPASEYERIVDEMSNRPWPTDLSTNSTSGQYRSDSFASREADAAVTLSVVDDVTVLVVQLGLF